MRMPLTVRTKVALLAGFLMLVTGTIGAAYLGSRDRRGAEKDGATTPVLYALTRIQAGTSASEALQGGAIGPRPTPVRSQPPGAVLDGSQIADGVAARDIPAGTILTPDMFPAFQTRIGTVSIPAGKRALSLQLSPVRGISGFAGAGDRIDVYAVVQGTESRPQGVQLILQGVEVLSVNGVGLPTAQGQPGGPDLVYLLAVTPLEAERLIYMSEFERLYFDLVPKGEPRVTTPGAGPGQALQAL